MSSPFISLSLLVALLTLTGCSGSMIPFSGGALQGTEKAPPGSWSFLDDVDVVRLETRPSQPYSVNLWVVQMDDALYVHAGANRATWTSHIDADDRVRLGDGDDIYLLRATRIRDADVYARFAEIYQAKYGNYPRNRNIDEIYFYQLVSRSRP